MGRQRLRNTTVIISWAFCLYFAAFVFAVNGEETDLPAVVVENDKQSIEADVAGVGIAEEPLIVHKVPASVAAAAVGVAQKTVAKTPEKTIGQTLTFDWFTLVSYGLAALIPAILILPFFLWFVRIGLLRRLSGKVNNSSQAYNRASNEILEYLTDTAETFIKRKKRAAIEEDRVHIALANKMDQLQKSFDEFELNNLGCQMLVACESAQLENAKHPLYKNLTPKIHKFLSSTERGRQAKSEKLEHLLEAHREGRKPGTSCKKLYGDLCKSTNPKDLAKSGEKPTKKYQKPE